MKEPKYGTMKKKVVFYDSDKRFADFKIRLEHDKLSQAKFFRGILTGYLEQDPDVLNFVEKLKNPDAKTKQNKKRNKQIRELIKEGREKIDKVMLDPEEIENIFDILEEQETNT
tara:strand:+ start:42 stop:383 length:342 start_codon:yes stop_codon:yes gene_type:complete